MEVMEMMEADGKYIELLLFSNSAVIKETQSTGHDSAKYKGVYNACVHFNQKFNITSPGEHTVQNFKGSNNDGSFTMSVSNSFLSL